MFYKKMDIQNCVYWDRYCFVINELQKYGSIVAAWDTIVESSLDAGDHDTMPDFDSFYNYCKHITA